MKFEDVKKIAILGSGAMGHGIAQVCITAGYEVSMMDIKQEFLDKGVAGVTKSFEFLVGKEKMTQDAMDAALALLSTTTEIKESVAGAQMVIEAVPEIMDLKKSVFKQVSDAVSQDVILVTNTSTMSVSEIGAVVANPSRFAGLHFFNPVNRMKLAEIIYGDDTSDATINILYKVTEKIKKIPVKVLKDRPGFIVNRINAPVQPLLSAILDEGKISPDSIDAVQKNLGIKMGAFELLDFVGLDITYHCMKYYEETLSPEWKPGVYLSNKIENKELGLKTGKGIYDWSSGKADIDMTQASSDIAPTDFIAVLLNESIKVYKEGVAESTADIDRAQVAGMNAMAGPFQLASGMDHEDITAALERLSDRYNLSILKPEPEIVSGAYKSMK
ncbi:MAG: 3-hydroxyacyl-CoA dehydrogenase family protein [bacterium]|nr:3-hydroxyacyl-CoA dehydrogenase family protein [bacterium]